MTSIKPPSNNPPRSNRTPTLAQQNLITPSNRTPTPTKKIYATKVFHSLLVPVENREEPIKSVLCVCVCPSRIISETVPRIFPKPGMKLGVKNVRNVARPLF